jgi:wyosine [tRNA(Phe)-imidazoG37] synthetase (radical SAM superfamily)
MRYVFGPVPSRRLGRSLGINNIPPKNCSYSCVYCQVGRTSNITLERRSFYPWKEIVEEVVNAVKTLGEEKIDYITFVPDGEPTLDAFLGKEIGEIKRRTNKPVAVLTNSSLLFEEEVRNDLFEADLVSVKVDAATEKVYRRINRPHSKLSLDRVLDGIREFSKSYKGGMITETMLVKDINDKEDEIKQISSFIAGLKTYKAYIAVPTRPPAEGFVRKAGEESVLRAYEMFSELMGREKVELLIGYEGADFSIIGNPVESLLSITSVHPMRIDYAYELLQKSGLNPEKVLEGLVNEGKIAILEYGEHKFIIKKISYHY